MAKQIINITDVEAEARAPAFTPPPNVAERYDAKMAYISRHIGAQKLGYNITVVPPGKSAFPAHNHRVNEEMAFVLQGSGEIRIGSTTHPIRTGDFIALPPGDKETAHKITNTGTEELRYLAVSTKMSPELVDYPDSGKFGVLAELPPGSDGKPQRFVYVGREGQSVDYWDGE